LAVRKTKCIFFQNNNDKEFFDKHGIKYKKCKVIPGSGVNLEKLQPLPYPNESEPIRFVYVGRVMKDKGIEQYLDAARAIKNKYPNTEFHICGYLEEDYKDIIDEKSGVGEVIYHGLVDDIKAYDEMSHCVVLPSFYPEGISNSLLEGAAYARPLITTDHVGCKEAVIDGVSGYIVRQRDSNDLIEKMVRFIELPYDDKVKMGIAGRKFVEENFDRNIVVDAYMKELDLI
jgi:galacturonosyltransferase